MYLCLYNFIFPLLLQVHSALETRIGFDMRPFKEYIDNEILVTMAQMDKPSKIFDYLYLVSDCSASKTVIRYLTTVVRSLSYALVNKVTKVSFHQDVIM